MTTFLLQAEMRLAVVGTLSGNDYAQNPRGMALKRICNMVKDNKYKDYNKANELMDKVNINTCTLLYVPGTHFPSLSLYRSLKTSQEFTSMIALAISKPCYNSAPHMSLRQVVMRAQG